MSRRIIIIDGYNVILRTPRLAPGKDRTLRESRESLVNILSWAMGGNQAKFIVVFDGTRDAGKAEPGTRVEVVFSRPPHSADDLIREMVEEHTNDDRPVTVVTADLEIARHARAMGADIALSDLFITSALGAAAHDGEGVVPPPEKPSTISKKELEEWAKIFRSRPDEDEDDEATDEPPPTVH